MVMLRLVLGLLLDRESFRLIEVLDSSREMVQCDALCTLKLRVGNLVGFRLRRRRWMLYSGLSMQSKSRDGISSQLIV